MNLHPLLIAAFLGDFLKKYDFETDPIYHKFDFNE